MDDILEAIKADEYRRDNPQLQCDGKVSIDRSLSKVCLPRINEVGTCPNTALFRLVYTARSGMPPRQCCTSCAGVALVPEIIHTMSRLDGQYASDYTP